MLTANLITPERRLPGYAIRWMSQTNWKVRILGSAALEASLVGAGVAHGAVTVNGKFWDVAAPAAIVLEAGGPPDRPRGPTDLPPSTSPTTKAKKSPSSPPRPRPTPRCWPRSRQIPDAQSTFFGLRRHDAALSSASLPDLLAGAV